MSFNVEIVTITRCSECNEVLAGPNHWALHRRMHMLQRLTSTEDGQRMYGMLRNAGFEDKPDKWLQDAANKERNL